MIVAGIVHWIPVIVVSLLAVPLAILAAVALVRLRVHRGDAPGQARLRSWTEVLMVAGTVPWVWMILTPLAGPHAVRPIPLVDILELLAGTPLIAFVQVAGNLLVFAAYGFLAPIRWRITPLAVLASAGIASAAVEAAQYLFDLGRVSSIDDVLLNSVGAGTRRLVLTALVGERWPSPQRPVGQAADELGARARHFPLFSVEWVVTTDLAEPSHVDVAPAAPPRRRLHEVVAATGLLVLAWLLPVVLDAVHLAWLLPPLILLATASLLRVGSTLLDRIIVALAILLGAVCLGGVVLSLWPWALAPVPVAGTALTVLVVAAVRLRRAPRLPRPAAVDVACALVAVGGRVCRGPAIPSR